MSTLLDMFCNPGDGEKKMNEQDYVVKLFQKEFSSFANKRIVLYGLSINTQSILRACSDYTILGLLDGCQESGEMYGQPILSLQQVADLQVDCIIIVARANSTKIIAKRIEKICRTNDIALYDLHGTDLLTEKCDAGMMTDHPYFSLSKEQVQQEIMAHEVISFDVFDTLVMRRVLYFADVFSVVERRYGVKGLREARIQAEREVNRQGRAAHITMIYQRLQKILGITSAEAARLQEQEMAVEREVLVVRRDMVQVMKFAIASGKRVYLISDMYWSCQALEDVLSDLGICGYRKLFVSSEYGKFKSQGLFSLFKQEVEGRSYLHIGDNAEMDIMYAQMCGLDTLRVYSALDMLAITSFRKLEDLPSNLTERAMLGLFLAEAFNSPFALYQSQGRPRITEGRVFGYELVAPLVTAFLFWMLTACAGHYDRILWAARDGYIFSKMYDIFCQRFPQRKLPLATYFYTSRMAAIPAALRTEEDIRYAAGIGFAGTPEELLRQRFFLRAAEILPRGKKEVVIEYVLRHTKIILQRGQELRRNYQQYIDSLHIGAEERLAFFDFVSSGTCQMCLEDILQRPLQGFYFIRFIEDYVKKKNLSAEAFIESDFLYALQSYLSTNYLPLESSIVSNQPTLQGFSEHGKPFFVAEQRKTVELEYVQQMQQGVIEYFSEFIDLLKGNPEEISANFVDRMYSLSQKRYFRIENCAFSKELARDEFCNRKYVMV